MPDNFRPVEKRILKAATRNLGRVEDIADAAGCSTTTVYKAMQKLEFRQAFNEALRGNLVSEVPQILKAFAEEARQGSYKHGKLILEMTETYVPPTKKVDAKIDAQIDSDDSMFGSAEERKDFIRSLASDSDGDEDQS